MTARAQTRVLVALIAALQVADVATTNVALRAPGTIESNPLMAWSQAHLGGLWWLPKLALAGLMAALFLSWGKPRPAAIAALFWVAVIGDNVLTIFTGY